MSKVYLGIGSNVGDREFYLNKAIELISNINTVEIESKSRIYETEPVGYLNQHRFLNVVIKISTDLEPKVLLDRFKYIERELKREKTIKWGPRTIDIDILLYDDINISTDKLSIPHERMFERAFVLVPLMDIIDENNIYYKRVKIELDKLEDIKNVKLFIT